MIFEDVYLSIIIIFFINNIIELDHDIHLLVPHNLIISYSNPYKLLFLMNKLFFFNNFLLY